MGKVKIIGKLESVKEKALVSIPYGKGKAGKCSRTGKTD